MQMITFINVTGLRTCLLVLMMLCDSVVTSQQKEMLMNSMNDKRFDVAPRDVITHSSVTRCAATCLTTSWCVSVNLQTGDGTCQLLSDEASNETPLATVDGWRYLRKFDKNEATFFIIISCNFKSIFMYVYNLMIFFVPVDICH